MSRVPRDLKKESKFSSPQTQINKGRKKMPPPSHPSLQFRKVLLYHEVDFREKDNRYGNAFCLLF